MNTNTTETKSSARLGKIARLPFKIRLQLNRRLENNEPAQRLVEWLNSRPEVWKILLTLFDGRPISKQNLSAWKQGGFRDWQRKQETRLAAREFLDEAAELEEEIHLTGNGDGYTHPASMLDRVADRMALSLLQLFREAELGEKGPQRSRTMLEAVRELCRLRRGNHQQRRAALAEEQRQEEKDEAREKEMRVGLAEISVRAQSLRHRYIRELAEGTLSPQDKEEIEEYFNDDPELFYEEGIPVLPEGEELAALVEEMRAFLRRKGEIEEAEEEPEVAEDDGEDEENDGENEEHPSGCEPERQRR